jgi:hypothetical protein
MRQPERLKRKVMTVMDKLRHVTPLPAARPSRHRWHVRTVAAVMAAGLALVLAALVTRNPLLFWAGYGLAALTWSGGLLWCRRHKCRPPRAKRMSRDSGTRRRRSPRPRSRGHAGVSRRRR